MNGLTRFLRAPEARRELVLAAAREAHRNGQLDTAVELYKRVGFLAQALDVINQRLSEALSGMAMTMMMTMAGRHHHHHSHAQEGEQRAAAMVAAGNDVLATSAAAAAAGATAQSSLVAAATSSPGMFNLPQSIEAFRQLETMLVFFSLAKAGKAKEALRELQQKLGFIPLDSGTSYKLMDKLDAIPRVVESRVPDVILMSISCLESLPDTDDVRALKKNLSNLVASASGRNWPQEVFERAAQMRGNFAF